VLLAPDGRVLTYPKPLTISRHTVRAVNTPLLSRLERFCLLFQSRLHSRSGRQFAFLLSKTRIPVATVNAIVQALIPPPKYHVDRLVPKAELKSEARLAGLIVIERGGEDHVRLDEEEALDILMNNCEDAYGFPPYPTIAPFLYNGNGNGHGRNLRSEERAIVASALSQLPVTLLRSATMDWWKRVPAVVDRTLGAETLRGAPPTLAPALPLAFE
jgi:hypothetical protein